MNGYSEKTYIIGDLIPKSYICIDKFIAIKLY